MRFYSTEHEQVAAILAEQFKKLSEMNMGISHVRITRSMLMTMTFQFATLYREQDPTFDYPRFLRESQGG